MTRYFLILLFIVLSPTGNCQYFKISGKVTNDKLEPLGFASVKMKDMPGGTLTKEDGTYELLVEEGNYDLIITMMGYKPQILNLVITRNYVQNVILETDAAKNLSEVIVKGKIRDRSEEIIRNVIQHKDELLAAAGPYSCDVYIKAVQDYTLPVGKKNKQAKGDTSGKSKVNNDLINMSMAEVSLHYDRESSTRIKEERLGVVRKGNPESLFFQSMTDGDFNLYNNLIKSSVLSVVPFLSPVSYSGIAAYRYKVTNTKQVNGRKIYTISVRPRQLSNVTVEGEVTIMDSAWVLLSAHFTLPAFHIPEYDFFEVDQQYSFVDNKAWLINRQQFTYYSKHGKGKLSGRTVASYSNFELNKTFPKKYFGAEVSATAQEAYEKDSTFWEKTRPEPLTAKEIRFIRYKDSIYRVTHTKIYLDSIDKSINKITWKKLVIYGQTVYDREKQRTWVLPPLTAIINPFEFGGTRLSFDASYFKTYRSRKNIAVFTDVSYGLKNHDINGNIKMNRMYNPFNRGSYSIAFERDFEYIFEGDAWINLIKRSNFYLNNGISLGHSLEIANGLFLYTDLDFAFRRSVSDYKTNRHVDSLFGDLLDDNRAIAFESYNAVYGKIRLQYTPGQRYIREPREKIILGSHWPTFYVSLRKGIPGVLNSKVDFDYLEYGIEQKLKLGTVGVSRYSIRSGSFLNRKDLRLVDYKFQRRGDPILFMNPDEAFQSLDSTFPVFNRFYQGHYVHEFNGAILSKVPLLKKLELREVVGGGFLFAPERHLRYAELFAGLEKVVKWPFNPLYKFKVGVYVVGSAANQFRNPVQLKIGFQSWDRKRNKWL